MKLSEINLDDINAGIRDALEKASIMVDLFLQSNNLYKAGELSEIERDVFLGHREMMKLEIDIVSDYLAKAQKLAEELNDITTEINVAGYQEESDYKSEISEVLGRIKDEHALRCIWVFASDIAKELEKEGDTDHDR